jgi:chemotaxis protein methyltransferase CheR
MDHTVFKKFSALIYEKSGIVLNESKEALVSSRIAKRMRQLGMVDQKDYLNLVLEDTSGEEIVQLLDVISTNVTHFFRESEHFSFVQDKVSAWIQQGARRFTFWSAACSSGEEPYSIAMVMRELARQYQISTRILATDISTRILEKSKSGRYDAKKMENVPSMLRDRYFAKHGRGEQAEFVVRDEIASLITFKRLNLSHVPYPMNGPMDIVFCRNVMIYFDNTVRTNLLKEIYRLLKPGGYLFVGHAESLTGILSGFKSVKPSVYIKA